jgi:PAS domain S-box-containing protein
MDNIPDHIYFKDLQSRFIAANKALAELFKLQDPAQMVGKTDFDFFSEKHARQAYEDEREIIRTGNPLLDKEEEETYTDRPGTWALTTKVPYRTNDGDIIGTCGISRDITKIKKAEEELARERNLLRTLIDTMPDYIFVKDIESRFVINNKAHIAVIGASSQEEILNKTDFDVFPRELSARYFSDEQVVLQTGRSIVGREEPVKQKDGREKWLSTTKVAVRDTTNEIVGLVGISRDITERKHFEEQLKRAKDELEIRVEERTADLKKANERLETRLSQLKFLNTSSYELAQFIRLEELALAIVESFAGRFPSGAQVSLCLRSGDLFKPLSATRALDSDNGRAASAEALKVFLETELQRPLLIENWTSDEHVSSIAWPGPLKNLPCYIALPLLADNKSLAVIQAFTETTFISVYEPEQTVLNTLAAHAAVCLSNAIHYQEIGERARLQGELDAARSIQRRFTPQTRPSIANVNMKGAYFPAFEVGGDYLDYFQAGNGNWVVVVADVCGKGIPAALFMTMLRSTFRVEARTNVTAKALLCAVNDSMRVNLDDKSFVTALCLVIDKEGTSMTYARAGHPMLLKLGRNGQQPANVKCNGIALGLVSDLALFTSMVEEVNVPLSKGDRFLVYTDGLTEATDPEKEAYGSKRLFELLTQCKGGPDDLIQVILQDVKEFARGSAYHDDLTILAMEVVGP